MWISKHKYEDLRDRVSVLERRVGTSRIPYGHLAARFGIRLSYGSTPTPMSLSDKVAAIIEHLDLKEEHVLEERRLVARRRPAKRKPSSTGSRKKTA